MPTEPLALETKEQFVEHYRRLCGFYARKFVFRWKKTREEETNVNHCQADIEDLASEAYIKLLKCPPKYWNEFYYVQRLIINAIITAFDKRNKILAKEWQPPHNAGGGGGARTGHERFIVRQPSHTHDYFDTLPGRDGLAESTQIKQDSEKIISALNSLTQAERLVLEFYFGLNGLKAIKEQAIAAKLGRTKFWVDRRLAAGLYRVRQEIGIIQSESRCRRVDTDQGRDANLA
jgi:RNA polymerase sigma factor (sigma-70 family)